MYIVHLNIAISLSQALIYLLQKELDSLQSSKNHFNQWNSNTTRWSRHNHEVGEKYGNEREEAGDLRRGGGGNGPGGFLNYIPPTYIIFVENFDVFQIHFTEFITCLETKRARERQKGR